jgi:hypothetical protein
MLPVLECGISLELRDISLELRDVPVDGLEVEGREVEGLEVEGLEEPDWASAKGTADTRTAAVETSWR